MNKPSQCRSSQQSTQAANRPSRGARLCGLLRLAAYCFALSLLVSTAALGSAWGDLKESSLILGRELSQFGDLLGQSQRLRLNGEQVFVASAISEQPVQKVLDRFETACREHAGGLVEEFGRLPDAVKSTLPAELKGAAGLGILRQGNEKEGMVACLSQRGKDGAQGTLRRLQEFLATGDLGRVGDLRYVYASRTARGDTHVVAVWTVGSFRVGALVSVDGIEPPGTDPALVPRPEEAVRLLSAEVEGAAYGIHIYDSPKAIDEVLRAYDEEMPRQGWTPVGVVKQRQPRARAYTRERGDILIVAEPDQGRTTISVIQLGNGKQAIGSLEYRSTR